MEKQHELCSCFTAVRHATTCDGEHSALDSHLFKAASSFHNKEQQALAIDPTTIICDRTLPGSNPFKITCEVEDEPNSSLSGTFASLARG